MKILKQPGNIVIRNCTAENCDRFIHYNFSGTEIWQLAMPLESLTLENIEASGIRMPLTAYGSPELPLRLTMRNMSFTFGEEPEDSSFMKVAHLARLELENIRVDRKGKGAFIKTWSHGGEISMKNVTSASGEPTDVVFTEETFECKAI